MIDPGFLAPRPAPHAFAPGSPEYGRAVAEAVGAVRARMASACAACGRDPAGVSLMAVTKFNPAEAVRAAYDAGVRLFGENRVQEAQGKFPSGSAGYPGARLELIGHLQGNKAKPAAELFDAVQSVDSVKLVDELGKRAAAAGRKLDILFELHTGEASKAGFPDAESLFRGVEAAAAWPSLRPRGLMTMAPYTDDVAAIRASFAACARAFSLSPLHGEPFWDTLSMGMTNDLELAIEAGSTLVRIGTAIFGERAAP